MVSKKVKKKPSESEPDPDPGAQAKERVISTARQLVSREQHLVKLREKYKTEKARINATVKEKMERALSAAPKPSELAAWRNDLVVAWQRKIEVEEFAKEQLAVAGTDVKVLRRKLKEQIENVDQMEMQFD